MKYLLILVDDGPSELDVENDSSIPQEHLQSVDDAEAEIIRWNAERNRFEAVVLDSDEDDEGTVVFKVDGWRLL